MNSPDICGCRNLELIMKADGVVEVSLIEASPFAGDASSPGLC